MCVIIIKQKGKNVDEAVLENSSVINPHGLGVVWLDSYQIEYFKSEEWEVLKTPRPYIAHFRYATVGKVSKSNTHPFRCGRMKDEYLMQNGSIYKLGSKDMTDTEHLALILGAMPRQTWADFLDQYDSRFVSINTKRKTFQIYNKDLWHKVDGVWFSKANVFALEYLAVYGTLKKGNSNYYHYLYDSVYVGAGATKDKYPLLVQGLPYLVEKKGVGHNVEVDVFRVDEDTLCHVDSLEGHPEWYYRKQIPIDVGGKEILCWIYFNPQAITHDTQFHKSYVGYQRSSYNHYYSDWYGSSKRSYERDEWDYDYSRNSWGNYRFDEELKRWVEEEEEAFMQTVDVPAALCADTGNCVIEDDGYGCMYCHQCGAWFTENQLANESNY